MSTSGGAGSVIYRSVAHVVVPQFEESLAFLEQAWPAASDEPGRFLVLQGFFQRLGDPTLVFDRIDKSLVVLAACVTIGPVTAATAVGAIVGGAAGGAISWIGGITIVAGVAIGAFVGAALAAGVSTAAMLAITGLARALEDAGIADTIPDDGGLRAAVLGLYGAYQTTLTLAPVDTLPMPDGNNSNTHNQFTGIAPYDLASASVEWERFKCHLEENHARYMHGLWLGMPSSKVVALIRASGVPAGVTETGFSGFVESAGALRVTDLAWLTANGVAWQDMANSIVEDAGLVKTDTRMYPTPGLTVEPQLGRCDACDGAPHSAGAAELLLDNANAADVG
jgi:hypothetical protein